MSRTYSVTIANKRLRRGRGRGTRTKSPFKPVLIVLILIATLVTGGYYLRKYVTSCEGDNCNPIITTFGNTIDPKLKQEDGLTNILIVGLDTRDDNPGLMNTDTIIMATVDHSNKTVVLTSIPRDFWVRYPLPNGNYASSKINSAYANGEWQQNGAGVDTLAGAVQIVTGLKPHYYVKITLRGFIEIIDAIGGVDIEIPAYYKDAYPYEELPPELQKTCKHFYHDGHYCLFEFYEGTEHMDGQRALIYARCRLLSALGDFDRAQRQQKVINAVKEKVLSTETLLDPMKLLELHKIVKDNIETSPFDINDIRAGLNLKDQFDTEKIGQVVLDPYVGHVSGKYIYRPHDYPARGYYIEPRDKTYQEIQSLLEYIRKYPQIYNEATKVSIYNATGKNTLETDWASEIEKDHPLFLFQSTNRIISNPNNQYSGISIYKFTSDDKPASEEYLKEFFGVDQVITDITDGTKALSGEDYVIVIGNQNNQIEETL